MSLIDQRPKNAELVFGLVAPIGTDATQVAQNLASQLGEFGYASTTVRLSDFIEPLSSMLGLTCSLVAKPEYERIKTRIDAANLAYQEFNRLAKPEEKNAMLALSAVDQIANRRKQNAPGDALLNQAHILVTLKRSEEVDYLRSVYGHGFHLIGVFAPEEERVKHLHRHKGMTVEQATSLVHIDANDEQDGGQRTSKAFHLSDVFLDVGGNGDDWKRQLGRFLDLLFSHPYKTPTRDEQAMFMAFSASLRSAQFGRQVGAAITSEDGDILSVGCNEVPKAGGGQYWERDDGDERDHIKGSDSNDARKNAIVNEVTEALLSALSDKHPLCEAVTKTLFSAIDQTKGNEIPQGVHSDDTRKRETIDEAIRGLPSALSNNKNLLRDALKATSLFAITEFGRAVHAEMEAILSCARKGISTVGRTLYTTTFPCHNCARHIIGAGIARVVYIEPYPKSKAQELHDDAIQLGESARSCKNAHAIPFVPFVGISPSKYSTLFTAKPVYSREVDRKLINGEAINWQRSRTQLRSSMVSISYLEREVRAIARLNDTFKQLTLDLNASKK